MRESTVGPIVDVVYGRLNRISVDHRRELILTPVLRESVRVPILNRFR